MNVHKQGGMLWIPKSHSQRQEIYYGQTLNMLEVQCIHISGSSFLLPVTALPW